MTFRTRSDRHALRVHQHGADRALSRRRPARGELSARARDRRRGRCDRHRRRRIAPSQSDQAGQNPLHDRVRQYLRQRRLPRDLRAGAGGRRLRWLSARARRRRRKPASCAASASAAISRFPARFRRKPRASRFRAAATVQGQHRRRRQRAGPHRRCSAVVAARRLGIAPAVRHAASGDSARDVPGFGAVASRSAMMVGGADRAAPPTRCSRKASASPPCCCRPARARSNFDDGKFSVKDRPRRLAVRRRRARRPSSSGRA